MISFLKSHFASSPKLEKKDGIIAEKFARRLISSGVASFLGGMRYTNKTYFITATKISFICLPKIFSKTVTKKIELYVNILKGAMFLRLFGNNIFIYKDT